MTACNQLKKIETRIESLSESLSRNGQRRPLSKYHINTFEPGKKGRIAKGKIQHGSERTSDTQQETNNGQVKVVASEGLDKRLALRKLPSTTRSMKLSDFEIGKVLGKGKLGKVYCARHKPSGYIAALKVMSKKDLVELKLEKNFCREIEIQSSVIHPQISRLYGFFYDHKNVYLILEYSLYGELYFHLKLQRRFEDIRASYYVYQVALALQYLHCRHIIHRDIKPENILLSLNDTVKLSDFGWSVRNPPSINKRLTICGTLDYLPPEMIESNEHDYTVDIWALGILCFEFLVGRPPFEEVDKNSTYKRIAKVDLKIPSFVSKEASDLITKLLQKNPRKRISLTEVLNHPWITKNKASWNRQTT